MLLATRAAGLSGSVDPTTTVEGSVTIGPGASVRDSALVGPVVIGAGCQIEGSRIGPNVAIEAGCTVRSSAISDAIVMEGCTISDVDALEGSILGRNVEVRHSGAPRAHRLVIGDQSRVEVD
jgi:glucose-1-phosphate thymidylyltransferase